MAVERLILEQSRMQADGHRAWVEAKTTTTDEFVASFLEARHAQAVVVHLQPLDTEAVGNPRPEDG